MAEGFYGVMIILGPILLAAAVIWAMLHNRVSRRQKRDTEAATRDLYKGSAVEDGDRRR